MTSGLQCPGCGHVHRLDEVGPGETFRCQACNKLLSVPAVVPAAGAGRAPAPGHGGIVSARSPGRGAPPAGNGGPARTLVPERSETSGAPAPSPTPGPPPAPMPPPTPEPRPAPPLVRMLVWLVALPSGLVAAALLLRALGLLDLGHAIDFFAAESLGRFAVLLVLLPLWAGLSATLAHLTLEALARRRARRETGTGRAAPEQTS